MDKRDIMFKRSIFFSLSIWLLNNCSYAIDQEVETTITSDSKQPTLQYHETSFIETIKELISLAQANLEFTDNFIEVLASFKTDISEINGANTLSFVSSFITKPVIDRSLKNCVRAAYYFHATEKITNLYILSLLNSLKETIVDQEIALCHPSVRIFKVHQPHGNETFPKKTLGCFFKPQLISAGYCPPDLLTEVATKSPKTAKSVTAA